jgi:hypothetical protein
MLHPTNQFVIAIRELRLHPIDVDAAWPGHCADRSHKPVALLAGSSIDYWFRESCLGEARRMASNRRCNGAPLFARRGTDNALA